MPSTDPRLVKDRDRYLVFLGDVRVGEVYRARHHTDRYAYHDPSYRGRGRWRWEASNVNDEDFSTRREAVAEMVRRFEKRRLDA